MWWITSSAYYADDYSLAEIAEDGVSRQVKVYDNIVTNREDLEDYEMKLYICILTILLEAKFLKKSLTKYPEDSFARTISVTLSSITTETNHGWDIYKWNVCLVTGVEEPFPARVKTHLPDDLQ